ncbi:MAG: hypothetical protein IKR18_01810 [Bacteroidaceae bacterium]|nr:hypothetical protein [Bacteroidaceae bacterium]
MNKRDDLKKLFKDKEFLDALNRYETLTAKGEQGYFEAEQLNDFASYYSSFGQDKKAEQAIRYALKLHPGDLDSTILLSRNYMIKGLYAEAAEIANSIKDKDDIEVRFLYAELNICTNERDKAMRILLDVIDSEDDPSERIETYKDVIDLLADYNEDELIDDVIARATKEFPDETDIFDDVVREANKSAELLIDECKTHLDNDPYDLDAWATLASAQFTQKLYDDALTSIDFILAIDPENPFVEMKAQLMFMRADWDCTIYFERAIAKAIERTQTTSVTPMALDCSTAYYQKDDPKNALRMLRVANQYLSDDSAFAPIVEVRNAIASLDEGDIIQSTAHLENARNLTANDEELNDINIEYAIALTRNEMYTEALALFEQTVAQRDTQQYFDKLVYHAVCLMQLDKIKECSKLISEFADEIRREKSLPAKTIDIFNEIVKSLNSLM